MRRLFNRLSSGLLILAFFSTFSIGYGQSSSSRDINGIGTAASFSGPYGVAVDSSGNVYVADIKNQQIRKIAPDGVVSTLAGSSGVTGATNGLGAAARFYDPIAVACDSDGNVYVADFRNYLIRKINPKGMVTTLAGSASYGSKDGNGTAASFLAPHGIAVDSSGNIFVGDNGGQLIRKITPDGMVTTLVGTGDIGTKNGNNTAISFSDLSGVAVDSGGNVYAVDNDQIKKITPEGLVSILAGSAGVTGSTDGKGTVALFNHPFGDAVDSKGNVYVADVFNNLIRKITPKGIVSTFAGSVKGGHANGIGTSATLYEPTGVAVDKYGNVYVAEYGANLVRKITSDGLVTTLAGGGKINVVPAPANIQAQTIPGSAEFDKGIQGIDAKDYIQAMKWFKKSAHLGYSDADRCVGLMYQEGNGVVKDYQQAMKWFKKAAAAGSAKAAGNVGGMYEDGLGVTKDYHQAYNWYKKAADHGDAYSQVLVGTMCDQGEGVTQDEQQALAWFQKAADQGYAGGENALGIMYASGSGVAHDNQQALKWFQKAADQGDAHAQKNLDDLNRKMGQ